MLDITVTGSTGQYVLSYTTQAKTEDWRYAVLTDGQTGRTVIIPAISPTSGT
ncbi:hypothetical protein [Intestinimonas massiliensis (ex Afouda et al. 2020)]|uniref:hypothetical protein n=1 Tax=Intestinimonas massiliensis (ex Afouda et al. 2020) TaxID=1673721 RepID=UPI0013EF31BB|nr:hypothetical protein [Intestinimonas massiliensis (ex Afouda et al. 2020)]